MAINNFNVGVGTTSQLTRYRYVATGGETSVSGSDADSKTLSYTVGLEQVFLNGVNLVRGQDYTATDGTSVGSLTALVASDVVEVFAFVPFNIANALTVSTVDAKGDLLVGTGADAVGRLAVGTDGQLLSAASGETSGLKWANGGLTLIETETFSASAAVNIDDVFSATYDNYLMVAYITGVETDRALNFRWRVSGADNSSASYSFQIRNNSSTTADGLRSTGQTNGRIGQMGSSVASPFTMDIYRPFAASRTGAFIKGISKLSTGIFLTDVGNTFDATTSFTGISLIPADDTITGTVSVYGYNQ
jgi:hypothetical protein